MRLVIRLRRVSGALMYLRGRFISDAVAVEGGRWAGCPWFCP
jgi:hypothetical protein